jgi:hypothetical protein
MRNFESDSTLDKPIFYYQKTLESENETAVPLAL